MFGALALEVNHKGGSTSRSAALLFFRSDGIECSAGDAADASVVTGLPESYVDEDVRERERGFPSAGRCTILSGL